MIEVFKTNIEHKDHADFIINLLHDNFKSHKANFDLTDCDRILRVECSEGLEVNDLLLFLEENGCKAELL